MSTGKRRIRVLVVDDSAFARQVVRRVLERGGDVDVVDIARDGAEALEKITLLRPDVVTLDLVMPHVDGLAVLEALPREGGPRVVVVSSMAMGSELGAAALAAGAICLVEKPTTHATDRMYDMAQALLESVHFAASARSIQARAHAVSPTPAVAPPLLVTAVDAVLLGTSTGGPQALAHLIPRLPADLPVPLVVVVHMPPGYVEGLARRLDGMSALTVREAHEGQVLTRGLVVLAPAGAHLLLERSAVGLRVCLDYVRRPGELHQPSVDALFTSGAAVLGERVLAVVMTGMGEDGLAGARALVTAGAKVLAQSDPSCVVYGMPRAIVEAGLAAAIVDLEGLAAAIDARVRSRDQPS